MKKNNWVLGSRYTYPTKDTCYKASLAAIADGYQVRYGISILGGYFFEIIDPWEDEWRE